MRSEKTRDIRLARVEASNTRPAGGVCVGDKRDRLLDLSAWAASNGEKMRSRGEGQIRQTYGDRRVMVATAVHAHGGLTTVEVD